MLDDAKCDALESARKGKGKTVDSSSCELPLSAERLSVKALLPYATASDKRLMELIERELGVTILILGEGKVQSDILRRKTKPTREEKAAIEYFTKSRGENNILRYGISEFVPAHFFADGEKIGDRPFSNRHLFLVSGTATRRSLIALVIQVLTYNGSEDSKLFDVQGVPVDRRTFAGIQIHEKLTRAKLLYESLVNGSKLSHSSSVETTTLAGSVQPIFKQKSELKRLQLDALQISVDEMVTLHTKELGWYSFMKANAEELKLNAEDAARIGLGINRKIRMVEQELKEFEERAQSVQADTMGPSLNKMRAVLARVKEGKQQ